MTAQNTAQTRAPLKASGIREAMMTLARARRPGCIWGPIGIGKSETAARVADDLFAAAYGYSFAPDGVTLLDDQGTPTDERPYLVDVRVALLDPVDLMGMPSVKDDVAIFTKPRWFPTDPRGGIVLLDEITRGSAMVQNALLQFTLNRRIGDHKLPAAWMVFAASNRAGDGGGVTRMNSALAERFIHLNMEADLDEWCQWAIAADVHPLVIAFLRYRSELFQTFDPAETVNANPRAWYFASELLKQSPSLDVELALTAGTVGYGTAGELLAFVRTWRRCPSVDAILLNPTTAPVPQPHEASALYAVTANLARRMDADNADTIAAYLDRLPTEYQAFVWKDANSAGRRDSAHGRVSSPSW